MTYEQSLRSWVNYDTQIDELTNNVKTLREEKNIAHNNAKSCPEYNKSLDAQIKIKVQNGYLRVVNIKETQPLTFKFLEDCLNEIITNEEQVNKIIGYVKNKRIITYKTEIKRYYSK